MMRASSLLLLHLVCPASRSFPSPPPPLGGRQSPGTNSFASYSIFRTSTLLPWLILTTTDRGLLVTPASQDRRQTSEYPPSIGSLNLCRPLLSRHGLLSMDTLGGPHPQLALIYTVRIDATDCTPTPTHTSTAATSVRAFGVKPCGKWCAVHMIR